jgi:uncharacterized protein (DUF2252 family)
MASTTDARARSVAGESREDRAAAGKQLRSMLSRSSHGEWAPAADRPDPVGLLQQQALSRVPELVPIRHGRMSESPFAFFRGAAAVMAADLAATAVSGLTVQLCGDAHLSNFGLFASPERQLVFDLNDFDETLPGPWEWDIKRLAASIEIAARERGFTDPQRRAAVKAAARSYREAIREFSNLGDLAVWYARLDLTGIEERWRRQANARQVSSFRAMVSKAHAKDSMRAFSKLTREVDGRPQIVHDPPLIVPIERLFSAQGASDFQREMRKLLTAYRRSLRDDARRLLARYRYAHVARKVVGVGSVGTRAWIVLLLGVEAGDPLFLQVKEAQASVLESAVGVSDYSHHGRRVVEGQRLMQASSDVLLGWLSATGADGQRLDYYVRQLWDWKGSAEVEALAPRGMLVYAQMCGWTLARAHAHS